MNPFFATLKRLADAGVKGVSTYLNVPILIILVPTFLLGAAIIVFSPKEKMLRYFGPNAKKHIAYPLASLVGLLLAVCSCGIIPLFAGIYRSGAGIGPSTTLLFAGPAINLLAIVYTGNVLGLRMTLTRGVAALAMSIYIGLVMAALYRSEEKAPAAAPPETMQERKPKVAPIFALLVLVLFSVLAVASTISRLYYPNSRCSCVHLDPWVEWLPFGVRIAAAALFAAAAVVLIQVKFGAEKIGMWLLETVLLIRMVIPFLLVGAFAAGVIMGFLPQGLVYDYLGDNSLLACLLASAVGAFSYFATLTEVPIVESLVQLYMSKGAALALLLAGPAVSLPSMIAIARVIGLKKMLSYVTLVIVLTALISCIVASVGLL